MSFVSAILALCTSLASTDGRAEEAFPRSQSDVPGMEPFDGKVADVKSCDGRRVARGADGSGVRYSGFGFTIPPSYTISGFRARLRARSIEPDGGLEITPRSTTGQGVTRTLGPGTGALADWISGGENDLWGRSWDREDFADGSFELELHGLGEIELDCVAVEVFAEAAGPGGPVSISILEPESGATLPHDRVDVSGEFTSDVENVAVTVNGVPALSRDGVFFANDVPVPSGESTLVATLTTVGRGSVSHEIQVTSTGGPRLVELHAVPDHGLASLDVDFAIRIDPSIPLRRVTLDFDGDGHADLSTRTVLASASQTYGDLGLVVATLTVTGRDQRKYTDDVGILVLDENALAGVFLELWGSMTRSLAAGDTAGALEALTLAARERFEPAFEALSEDWSGILTGLSTPTPVAMSNELLEFAVNRTIDGENRIFFVYAIRDADGAWRIDGM